jgi:predicted Zn-dependent protease with MMP-like domain
MNNAMPEVFPKIVVDREYGKFVDYIDLDLQKVSDHLRNSGLTDEQILETNINLKSRVAGERHLGTNLGKYNRFNNNVNIYALEILANNNLSDEQKDEFAEDIINHTIVHELEHRIASFDKKLAKENRNYHIKETVTNIRMLGMLGLASLVNFGGLQSYNQITNMAPPLPVIIGGSVLVFMGMNSLEKKFFREQHYNEYLNRPEELRAEKAAKNYKDSLITLTLKHNL